MDTSGYLHFLGILREHVNSGTIQEYLKNNFKNPKDIPS